ncbi:hypothetical protein ACVWYQ_003245 [Bradyrhizobium sp. USDA 3397]
MKIIAELTQKYADFPAPHVRASRLPNGAVRLTVCGRGGKHACIDLEDDEWRSFVSQALISEESNRSANQLDRIRTRGVLWEP